MHLVFYAVNNGFGLEVMNTVRKTHKNGYLTQSEHDLRQSARGHDGVSCYVFRQFAWLQVSSSNVALFRSAHQYPTDNRQDIAQAVDMLCANQD